MKSSTTKTIKKIMIRILMAVGILVITGYLCTSCFNYRAAKTYKKNVSLQPFDAIIVPGVPFENDKWSDIMKIRVYWSHYLYSEGIARNIIYSGSAVYSPYIESKIMALYGQELGIPKENIFVETKAEHSTENLYYSFHLARDKGFKKIAVATDPFQSAMLVRFAKKRNLDVHFLPIVFDTLKKIEKYDPQINPQSAYVENFVPLPERESFMERMSGTMGNKIEEVE
jgi:uncharacterized SAM-binding protein YcdF (DUF218 family)